MKAPRIQRFSPPGSDHDPCTIEDRVPSLLESHSSVDLYPDYWLVHFGMGLAQSQKGSLQQAIASVEKTHSFRLPSVWRLPSWQRRTLGRVTRTTPTN